MAHTSSPRDSLPSSPDIPDLDPGLKERLIAFTRRDSSSLLALFQFLLRTPSEKRDQMIATGERELSSGSLKPLMASPRSSSHTSSSSPSSLDKSDSADKKQDTFSHTPPPKTTPIAAVAEGRTPACLTFQNLPPNKYSEISAFLTIAGRRTEDGTKAAFCVSRDESRRSIIITDAPDVAYGAGLKACLEKAKNSSECLPSNFPFIELEEKLKKLLETVPAAGLR
jgi:hypothetical protein